MRLLILKAWPALIPIALYLIWILHRRRKAKKLGEPLPALLSGPWVPTLAVSLALFGSSLIFYALSSENNAGVSYQPKRFENGKLIEENLE